MLCLNIVKESGRQSNRAALRLEMIWRDKNGLSSELFIGVEQRVQTQFRNNVILLPYDIIFVQFDWFGLWSQKMMEFKF